MPRIFQHYIVRFGVWTRNGVGNGCYCHSFTSSSLPVYLHQPCSTPTCAERCSAPCSTTRPSVTHHSSLRELHWSSSVSSSRLRCLCPTMSVVRCQPRHLLHVRATVTTSVFSIDPCSHRPTDILYKTRQKPTTFTYLLSKNFTITIKNWLAYDIYEK